jgi:hypothetical protein
MKIRSGFVSNSSSSSFLIYGTTLDAGEVSTIVKKMCDEGKCKDYEGKLVQFEDIDGEELYSLVEYLKLPKGIDVHSPSYSDVVYVGASWDTVKDDETGKEFKNRVFETLKEAGLNIKKNELDTLAESWYDG